MVIFTAVKTKKTKKLKKGENISFWTKAAEGRVKIREQR